MERNDHSVCEIEEVTEWRDLGSGRRRQHELMSKQVVETHRSDHGAVLRMHLYDVTEVSPRFGFVAVNDRTGVEGIVTVRGLNAA